MPNGPILIAAFSGRALAESARRSGYEPYVADLFGDEDTIAASAGYRRLEGDLESGFTDNFDETIEELSEIARSGAPLKLVYGGGFDGASAYLSIPSAPFDLAGNRPEIIRLIKNPFVLGELCKSFRIKHPAITPEFIADGRIWLEKKIGGAGGGHIQRGVSSPPRKGVYYQEEVAGRAISALFIADEEGGAGVVGYSEQWISSSPQQPFRYGGAAQPASLSMAHMREISRAVKLFAAYFALRGLNSADFIVDGAKVWLLEINPRPGATLELFDNETNKLFDQHVRPAGGISRWEPEHFHVDYASAAAVVYADRGDLIAPAIPDPPDWLKDRPQPGSKILRNQPLCTVLAKGETLGECRQVCAERGLFAQALYYK